MSIVAYKRSWCKMFSHNFDWEHKERKKKQKRKKPACGNCRSHGNRNGGLRRLLLDDFHRCLEKPTQKTLQLFHSYHRPGDHHLLTLTRDPCHLNVSHVWGAPQHELGALSNDQIRNSSLHGRIGISTSRRIGVFIERTPKTCARSRACLQGDIPIPPTTREPLVQPGRQDQAPCPSSAGKRVRRR